VTRKVKSAVNTVVKEYLHLSILVMLGLKKCQTSMLGTEQCILA